MAHPVVELSTLVRRGDRSPASQLAACSIPNSDAEPGSKAKRGERALDRTTSKTVDPKRSRVRRIVANRG